jgi:hypothetical protein
MGRARTPARGEASARWSPPRPAERASGPSAASPAERRVAAPAVAGPHQLLGHRQGPGASLVDTRGCRQRGVAEIVRSVRNRDLYVRLRPAAGSEDEVSPKTRRCCSVAAEPAGACRRRARRERARAPHDLSPRARPPPAAISPGRRQKAVVERRLARAGAGAGRSGSAVVERTRTHSVPGPRRTPSSHAVDAPALSRTTAARDPAASASVSPRSNPRCPRCRSARAGAGVPSQPVKAVGLSARTYGSRRSAGSARRRSSPRRQPSRAARFSRPAARAREVGDDSTCRPASGEGSQHRLLRGRRNSTAAPNAGERRRAAMRRRMVLSGESDFSWAATFRPGSCRRPVMTGR